MFTTSGAKAITDIGNKITLLDAQGNQVKGGMVQENVLYQFQTNPKVPYDALYNEMFKKEGRLEQNVAGSKVTITNIATDPNHYYLTIDGVTKPIPAKDINLIIREVEYGINQAKGTTK
jgi:hypothetical protein